MRNDRDPRHPDQVRLETALRIAWADQTAPPLAFRAVLGRYCSRIHRFRHDAERLT